MTQKTPTTSPQEVSSGWTDVANSVVSVNGYCRRQPEAGQIGHRGQLRECAGGRWCWTPPWLPGH